MKSTRARSVVLYVLSLLFICGLGLLVWQFAANGAAWAVSPFNKHVSGMENAGKLLDRNGQVLAATEDGRRRYHTNVDVRRALLHTVGDQSGNLSTGMQDQCLPQLMGYNFITGTGLNRLFGGNDVTLTVDADLCKTAYQALGGRHGAAAVYNYHTGEILCMVSTPSYDPENPPDPAEVAADQSGQYEGLYLNRVLSSSFTPGSTFKIVTSAAAIENIPDLYTRTFTCTGSMTVGGEKITCLSQHGNLSFEDGMAKSCNIVFAQLAMELGKEKMTKTAEQLGFGESFDIDGIPTAKSNYNVEDAGEAALGWSGIGQHTDLVNPMHMLVLMGAVANGGAPVEPYLVQSVSSSFGLPSHTGTAHTGGRLLAAATAEKLRSLMRYTVQNNYGDDRFPGLSVCAKTGTAEVGEGKQPHGWMVGFAEDADCPLAFVVVVENGGYGIQCAAPIAQQLMAQAAKMMRSTG
jgi:peptidoglycan glycosyltransferase